MRYLFVAAAKDIRRRLADPAAFAFWIGLPLLLGGLLSFISDSGGPPPRATVLVVDEDATFASGLLLTALERAPTMDLQNVSLDEGRRRIGDGDATALLVVPAGFQQAVLETSSTSAARAELELVADPAPQILPGIVEETLEIAVEGVFYAQQIFGPALRRIADQAGPGPPTNADVAAIAVEINGELASLRNILFPPAVALTVVRDTPARAAPSLSFGQLFLPGMLFMSLLFIAGGMAGDIWEEQQMGTLRRALATPQSARKLLAGKLVAGMIMMAAIGLVALAAGAVLFDIAPSRIPGALAWSVFAGGALLALFTPLQMLASSQRAADMLASTISFPLMMLGGSFFPFETMPEWMAAVGHWTPNGLGVARLKDLLYGDVALETIAVAVLAIGIPAAVALLFAARRLRRRFAVL
jgi:ABC-type multidrug transport system permease subunit